MVDNPLLAIGGASAIGGMLTKKAQEDVVASILEVKPREVVT